MKPAMLSKYSLYIVFLSSVFFSNVASAGCWVQDGTFYAKKKQDMTAFAIYMDSGKKSDALRMVDDGRIKSCTQASATVIERDGPLVNAQIMGIGKVWIYETFLQCR